MIFAYRSRGGDANVAQLNKGPLERPAYVIDFADGALGAATLSSTSITAFNASNVNVTSICVGTTTISGTTVQQILLTCGTSGTAAPPDGARFKIVSDITLSNGEILNFNTYVFISAPTYAPTT